MEYEIHCYDHTKNFSIPLINFRYNSDLQIKFLELTARLVVSSNSRSVKLPPSKRRIYENDKNCLC